MAKSLLDFYGQPEAQQQRNRPTTTGQRSLLDAYQPSGRVPATPAPQDPAPNQDAGLWSDTGNLLKMGAGGIGRGVGYLTGIESLEQAGAGLAERSMQALSPAQQQAMQNEFVTHSDEEGYGFGPALTETPVRSLYGALVSSLPATAAGMGVGGVAAKGLGAVGSAMATRGVAGGATLARPAVSGAVGFGAGEGLVSAGISGSDVKDFVRTADQELLDKAPGYQELIAQGLDPDTARETLAEELAANAALGSGAIVGLLGAPMGAVFGRWMGGVGPQTMRGAVLGGAAGEAVQEAGQSAGEEYIGGAQRARIDPTEAPTLASMADQAVGGALAGGAMGAGFGGFQGYAQQKRNALLDVAGVPAGRLPETAAEPVEQRSLASPQRRAMDRAGQVTFPDGSTTSDPAVVDAYVADRVAQYPQDQQAEVERNLRARLYQGKAKPPAGERGVEVPGATQRISGDVDRPGVPVGEPTVPERKRQQAEKRPTEKLEQQAQRLLTVDREKGLSDSARETLDAVASVLLERPDADPQVRALVERYGQPTGVAGEPPPSDRPSLVDAYEASTDQAETPPVETPSTDQSTSAAALRPDTVVETPPSPADTPQPALGTPEPTSPPAAPSSPPERDTPQSEPSEPDRPSQPPAGEDAGSVAPFTPTHEAPDGTPLRATAEPDVYEDADGVEIEEANATPIAAAARPPVPADEGAQPTEPVAAAPTGKRTRATTPRGTEVEADLALVDAGSLITSNDSAGNVNPDYPASLQPRDRQRATSQTQVNRIARGIRPELLGDTGTATGGAPIIGPDGVVESGNGRTLALQQAYREGGAEGYKQWLKDNAKQFGLTPEQVDGMDAPVLVRRRATEMSDAERARFAREANQSDVQAMSPSEAARADAERITPDMLKGFAPSEDGNVLAASNRAFVQNFAAALGETEAAGLRDAEGNWTRQMSERITSAIFAKAYGSNELLALQAETADPDSRNMVNALVTAAGEFARARAVDESLNNGTLDIVTPLVEAVQLVRSTPPGRLEERLGQADMFAGDTDADVAALARFIDANKRSARRMGEAFKAMGRYIRNELRSTERLLGEPATRGTIISAATRKDSGQSTLEQGAQGGREGGQPDRQQGAEAAPAGKAKRKPAGTKAKPDETKVREPVVSGYERPTYTVQAPRQRRADTTTIPLDFDTEPAPTVPLARAQARDNLLVRYNQVPQQTVRVGVEHVTTPEDAAHVLAFLRKHGQESLVALVTDDAGTILNLIRHTKGAKDQSQVFIGELLSAVAGTDGGTRVWLGHNHPSGVPDPSQADYMLTEQFNKVLDATGITLQGHIVLGEGRRAWHFDETRQGAAIETKALPRKRTISMTERVLAKAPPKDRPQVRNVKDGKSLIKGLESSSGVLLLDNKHRMVGVLAMTPKEMNALREGGQARRILKAIDTTNTVAAIPFGTDKKAIQNVASFLNIGDKARVLDVIHDDAGVLKSYAETGLPVGFDGTFYSRATTNRDAEYLAAVERGDMDTAQRLVDEAAREDGYDIKAWHGSPDGRFIETEYKFKNRWGGQGVHWFAKDRGIAASYADDRRAFDYQNAEAKTFQGYLRLRNPLEVDGKNQEWRTAQSRGKTSDVIEQALEQGHDGVVIRNVKDAYSTTKTTRSTTTYAVFDSSAIKSAEAVTRDNAGNVIPLSQRFNPRSEDIRFARGTQSRNTAEAVRTELNLNRRAERALLDSGLVNIVQSASEIPGSHPSDVAGAYHQGKVYLVADNIPAGRAEGLLLHEIGVHHGLRTMVGEAQYAQIVETLKRQVRAGSLPGASRAAREAFQAHVRASSDSTVTNPDVLWEETIAYLAESGSNAPVLRRIMAAVRAFLRRLGLASDFTAADMAQLARGSIQRLVEGMEAQGQPATMYHRVFHGTPHLWQPEPGFPHGRPRLDKIGTGEGAAAYGHGVYLAEAEAVARGYRDELSEHIVRLNGRTVDLESDELSSDEAVVSTMFEYLESGASVDEALRRAISDLQDSIEYHNGNIARLSKLSEKEAGGGRLDRAKRARDEAEQALDAAKRFDTSRVEIERAGQLYHLDIPENVIPTLLDWDAKLSEQPQAVQAAILDTDAFGNNVLGQWLVDEQDGKFVVLHGEFGKPPKKTGRAHATEDAAIKAMEAEQRDMLRFMTGEELYRNMVQATMETNRNLSGPEAAKRVSETLRDAGIPGNRYLDAGSRGTGDENQTRNVVLWSQDVLDRVALLKRNEEALDAIQAAQYSRAPQTDTKAFKDWFKDSVVTVDGKPGGEPKVVYHGTAVYPGESRSMFSVQSGGRFTYEDMAAQEGIFFTDSEGDADFYAGRAVARSGVNENFDEAEPETVAVYLSVKNPLVLNDGEVSAKTIVDAVRKAQREGYDGVHLPMGDDENMNPPGTWIVFKPEQIKSATGNTGTFDPTNPDIRYSRRPADTTPRAALGRSLLARNRGDVAAAQREAKALYPGLAEDIGDWIEQNRDRWQESGDDVGTMYSRADQYDTPEQEAAMAKIDPESPSMWTRRKLTEALENWQYKLRQGTIDQFDKLLRNDQAVYGKDVVERLTRMSAWVLSRQSKSAEGALQAMIYHGRPFMDNGAINVDETEKSLLETFEPLQGEVNDFLAWVAGNRAERLRMEPLDEIVRVLRSGQDIDGIRRDLAALNLNDIVRELDNRTPESLARQLNGYRSSGLEGAMQAMQAAGFKNSVTYLKNATRERLFDDTEIKALKTLNQGTLPDGQDRDAVYRSVQRDFRQLQKAVLDIVEGAGLINAQDRAIWEHDFYVPFFRVIEDDAGDIKTRGLSVSSGLVKQKAIERLKGGKEGLNDLLTNTLMNWNHLLGASLRNQAADRALDTAQKLGIATKLKAAEKGSVYVMRDGQPVHYQVDDPLTLEAITALDWQGMRNPAMRLIRGAKRLFTRVVTISPAFQIANLMRDSIHSIAVTKIGANPMANVARGWKQFDINRGKMLAGGGAFQFGARLEGDSKAIQRHLEKQVKGNVLLADTPNKAWKGLQDALQAWDNFSNRTENVNRAALYQQLRDQGHDHLYASFQARDLMDFSQTGAWASTRFLTMAVPFLNARLQGLDKLGRAGLDPKQRVKFALTVGAVMAASSLLYLINSDDERFRELEEWQRDSYWWFFAGDLVLAIPKPFEVGAMGTLAERALEQAVDAGADGTLFLQRLKHVLLETFSFNPTPQIVAPLLDLYANRDPFRDRPIESMSLQNMSPTQRATVGTSEFAKGVSWLLNPALETATNSSLSPVQVDYLVAGYFGWIGQQALKVSDLAAKPAVGLPSAHRDWLYDTPLTGDLARRFLPDLDRNAYTKSLTAFYEDLRKKEQLWADFRTHREQGDVNAARGILEQEPGLQLWLTHARRVQRRLSDIRKQTNRVQRDGRLSAAERERRIRVLNQQRKDVARSFMSVQGG